MYYGWKQRGDELAELKERYGKMLDHMDRHYMEMTVEPTFTFSGTAADVTPYQQQIGQMLTELQDYVSASSGLPDPNYVRQQQTNIARLQAALDTLPAEAPGEEAFFNGLAQTIMGNYYDKTTPLGTVMQAAVSAIPHPVAEVLDLAADIRDVVYDFTEEEASKAGTFFDVLGFAPGAFDTLKYFKHAEAVGPLVKGLLALLPAAEVLKYVDELGLLGKGAKRADDMADVADAAADAARAGQRLTATGEVVADTAKATERTLESADEVIDSGKGLGYNGGNRFGDIDLKPADLMEELANSGVKYTEDDVLMVTRNSNGDLMWLETGTNKKGWAHILEIHKEDFRGRDIVGEDAIFKALRDVLQTEPVMGPRLKHDGYEAIYRYSGSNYLVAYGTNGFIISFYPKC